MVTIKTPEDIKKLREGGARLGRILKTVAASVAAGVSTGELDIIARKLIGEGGDISAFLNYKPRGSKTAYPAALCVSINDEIVHGIPDAKRIIQSGDVVSLDLGLIHDGLVTDHALTVVVGKVSSDVSKLLDVTKQALKIGIAAARGGKKTGDIGFAIQEFVKPYKLGIVEELTGHGVGYSVHEDPFVPNYGNASEGVLLKPGMVIAIEPMLTLGGKDIIIESDDWTIKTADGSLAAHFEHTILITDGAPEILTIG